jgi:tyrosinase
MADIRFFFTPEDIDHMDERGIDLATYEGVKTNALRIIGATEPPDPTMPPDPRDN